MPKRHKDAIKVYQRHVLKPTKKKKVPKQHKLIQQILSVIFLVAVVTILVTNYLQRPILPKSYGSGQDSNGYYYYSLVEENDYYYRANGLSGDLLSTVLHQLLQETITPQTYGTAKQVLAKSDRSRDPSNKVWNIYDGALVEPTWDAKSWHREHVWPNSRLGIPRVAESSKNQGSDLHNLRAITPSVNSSRSNRYFAYGEGTHHTTVLNGYYPGDEHKGDVARILFYMAIMYDFLILTDDEDILKDSSNAYLMEGAKMGRLSLLLAWHKDDPVDEFEIYRNHTIYQAQGNRNPFIDKPEYVHLIWEQMEISDLTPNPSFIRVQTHIFMSMIENKRLYVM